MATVGAVLTLVCDDEVFALPVERVQEILDLRPTTRLPNAPSQLIGMIDVQGSRVAVADLRASLGMPPTKRNMIETRLSGRIRELGFRNTQEYFRNLFEGGGLRTEMSHIEERVTTNKTDFFRETDHFNYLRDVISPVPAALRNRYLCEGQNEWRGKWRISTVPRNVLIYFDPDVQLAALRRVRSHLAPGGHLFVGHSESMIVRMPGFHQVAPAIFRKDL